MRPKRLGGGEGDRSKFEAFRRGGELFFLRVPFGPVGVCGRLRCRSTKFELETPPGRWVFGRFCAECGEGKAVRVACFGFWTPSESPLVCFAGHTCAVRLCGADAKSLSSKVHREALELRGGGAGRGGRWGVEGENW